MQRPHARHMAKLVCLLPLGGLAQGRPACLTDIRPGCGRGPPSLPRTKPVRRRGPRTARQDRLWRRRRLGRGEGVRALSTAAGGRHPRPAAEHAGNGGRAARARPLRKPSSILARAVGDLRRTVKFKPVVFELMHEAFTLFELQRVVEAILGPHLHKQNFRRLIEGCKPRGAHRRRAAAYGRPPGAATASGTMSSTSAPLPGVRLKPARL